MTSCLSLKSTISHAHNQHLIQQERTSRTVSSNAEAQLIQFPRRNLKNLDPKILFSNFANLKKFFDDSPDILGIIQRSQNFNHLYYSLKKSSDVTQITPERVLAHYRKSEAIDLSSKIKDQSLKKKMDITGTHLYMIQTMKNQPNKKGDIIRKFEVLPNHELTDPKVIKRTFCTTENPVQFNHLDGICEGICDWFGYLYLKTAKDFVDPRTQMVLIGERFKNGGGADATLLQSLYLRKGKLLNLKIGVQSPYFKTFRGYPQSIIAKTSHQWNANKRNITKCLKNLSPGVYKTNLPIHATLYVKINQNLGFFVEPNKGILEIDGNLQGKVLYYLLSETLKRTGVVPSSKLSKVEVIPVTLRN